MSELFIAISNKLNEYNLQCLKFLCTEYTSTSYLEKITEGYELFQVLNQNGKLKNKDSWLLKELIFRIKRMDILKNPMGANQEEIEKELEDRAQISPYRVFLFQIAEQLSRDQVEKIKFLLHDKVSRPKLQKKAMLEIFLEMERTGLLAEDNFQELKDQMKSIQRIDLLNKITFFEETRKKGVPQQESHTDAKRWTNPELQPREEQRKLPTPVERQRQVPAPNISETHAPLLGEAYRMGDGTLGYCLIINNFDFSASVIRKLTKREGTNTDAETLKKIFQWLQFTVEERQDLTASEICQAIEKYRTNNHGDMSCFVCCILSHGHKGEVYGTDGLPVLINELIDLVNGQRCKSLAGKPKVFFIQACQGNKPQTGVPIQTDSVHDFESDAAPMGMGSIPIKADVLLGMATVEDYESYRHTSDGSIYMQSLCKHLEKLCPREFDLMTILTEVNKEVATKVLKGFKQMPEIRTTLRKKLVFPVPLQKPDGFREEEAMDTCD
ncbi:caspase-8-like [Lissotriton helveticus]